MQTISELKEQAVTESPLLLFECTLRDGTVERWSTHRVTVDGQTYEARVLGHNVFEVQAASDQGADGIPRIALALANADSHFSQLERTVGWKGARMTVRFLFYDLRGDAPASESTVLFQGLANPPEEITESVFRLSAINRLSMQRVLLPEVRIQRLCPWEFPSTPAQRQEGVTGGDRGRYSRFFRCGYSPDADGGVGNSEGGAPFAACGRTRADCEARGMFQADAAGRGTRRFGGIEFVPSSIWVRSYGEKGWHAAAVSENTARYNDLVPLVYGTAWFAPPVVFARNDGNLTHLEVLLGMGEIEGVVKVLVNDIEIPRGSTGANMTGTGWYNLVSRGNRTGDFNLDFSGGDPYGSMAYLSLVVPTRINDGQALPSVKVLIQGLRLATFGADGTYLGDNFTNNPAWVLLDLLQRGGWALSEMDLGSFAAAAAFCEERIDTQDLYGKPIQTPRFQCNLVVDKRRSAGDLIRGIRNASRLLASYGAGGLLQLRVENSLALEQAAKPEWSNANETLNGGWPSYEFGDGSSGTSGILRRSNGEASLKVWSRNSADTPNRFSVEFQDAFNEYQQDSYSLVDSDDVDRTGQEVTAPLTVLGLPHYDQAARILKFYLDKSIAGNVYVTFDSSVKAVGLRPGDVITVTYLKEGFERQPFRVVKLAPGLNYRTVTITAQIHDDGWYEDTNGQVSGSSGGRRQPGFGVGLPHPLMGNLRDDNGEIQYEISESATDASDGGEHVEATVGFLAPAAPHPGGPGIPLVSLSATISEGGKLAGGQTLYYAVSGSDAAGGESALSFLVPVTIPGESSTNSVTLGGLSFAPGTVGFDVYRGTNPAQLYRIASDEPVAEQFTDDGLDPQVAAPPDANYDHANFYWRLELQPEYAATLHTTNSVGNEALQMEADAHQGMTVRITKGRGAGQERTVTGNTATELTVQPEWAVEPDATSEFAVAESGWHFGASAKSSPVQFEIPNRAGAVLHISGRAANVNDEEAAPELCTLTRWVVGGSGHTDADLPPTPVFGLGLAQGRGGTLELSGVSFEDLTNTRTIVAGTLTLHYHDELAGLPALALAVDAAADATTISLSAAGSDAAGSFVQIEGEVLRVEEVLGDGTQYRVTRGVHTSEATTHAAGTPVYSLLRKVLIAPFPQDFFGSPYSGSWTYPVLLPEARVASAELFVTNRKGNSGTAATALTGNVDYGLRTLSGGQFSFQVQGFLAVDLAAAPDVVVEAAHAVRDVYAVVKQAPDAPVVIRLQQDGSDYCTLTIPAGGMVSNTVDGLTLPPLSAGARLSLAIDAVGTTQPGADLTVVMRL
ncbi:MAG TPA: phage tail protein [Bryobacteraceae bacterium]|nr:phage tail protein [Bryobacteraceae bacterium]